MRWNRWILAVSILLCMTGVGTIALMALVGKGGELDGGRLGQGKLDSNLAAVALLSSPLLALAALCAWWRHDRSLAVAGLTVAGIAVGVTLWGTVADYLSWSRRPPPTDQVTYLAAFFAMLASWVLCLAYGVVGLVARSWRR